MTHQVNLKGSGFRNLSVQELETVCGGSRIAYAREDQVWRDRHTTGTDGYDATLGDPNDTISLPGSDYIPGTEDYNADGIVDEIVVERERIAMVDDDYYGLLNPLNGYIDIYKDTANWFEEWLGYQDQFMGTYVAGSPQNAALVLTEGGESSEHSSGFNVTVMGNGGGTESGSSYSSTSGNTQYFQRVEP